MPSPTGHRRRTPRTALAFTASLLLIGGLAGCSSSESANPSTPQDGFSSAEVPWQDYAPEVKQQIDILVSQQKCNKLQREFDQADQLNDVTFNRTGHNNAELMAYIDDGMRAAGCYPDDPLAP